VEEAEEAEEAEEEAGEVEEEAEEIIRLKQYVSLRSKGRHNNEEKNPKLLFYMYMSMRRCDARL